MCCNSFLLNPIQDGVRGCKIAPYQFFRSSPVTSTNAGISPKNFHTSVKFQGHNKCQSQIIELKPRTPVCIPLRGNIPFGGNIFYK